MTEYDDLIRSLIVERYRPREGLDAEENARTELSRALAHEQRRTTAQRRHCLHRSRNHRYYRGRTA